MSVTLTDLRGVDLFDDIGDDLLAEWAAVADPHEAAAGELRAEQGEPPPGALLLLREWPGPSWSRPAAPSRFTGTERRRGWPRSSCSPAA